jgi:hypothetical protein
MEKVNHCREFSVHNKRFCETVFVNIIVQGGCPSFSQHDKVSGLYDDFCIETRMISAAFLLDELNQSALKEEWLSDEDSIRIMAAQSSDRWLDYRSMAIAEL